jgi:hypothetical protein
MVAVQQNAPAARAFDEKVDQLLAKARLPMGQDEAQEVAELLERVSRSYLHPLIDALSQRWIDVGSPLSNYFAYEKAMLPGAREALRGIQYSPQSVYPS